MSVYLQFIKKWNITNTNYQINCILKINNIIKINLRGDFLSTTNSKKKSIILVVCICIIVAIAEIGMFIHNKNEILNQKSKAPATATTQSK